MICAVACQSNMMDGIRMMTYDPGCGASTIARADVVICCAAVVGRQETRKIARETTATMGGRRRDDTRGMETGRLPGTGSGNEGTMAG
jgi:hypothetical protein